MKFTTTDFADRPSIDLFLFQNWISTENNNSFSYLSKEQ